MNAPPPGSHARRVLIADDSRSMRMVIGRSLKQGGYDLQIVEDGHALREAIQRPDAPRIIVSDWVMPGPSGVDICREMRQLPGGDRFYFIVVTANTEPDHLLEALQAGADDFICKPFSSEELLARVNAGHRVVELQASLESKIAELGAALAEVRTLRGLLPICMHCHRIRTGSDDWQKLEAYLEEHSEAQMSHALCDECLEKFYPDPGSGEAA